MTTTADVIAVRLESMYRTGINVFTFEEGDFFVSVISQKKKYLKELITPSPTVWIIEHKDLSKGVFGVSMVPYNRFKELREKAIKERMFPLSEVMVYQYEISEMFLAATDIELFHLDQNFVVNWRPLISASEFMGAD
jgi:hypothetical protein